MRILKWVVGMAIILVVAGVIAFNFIEFQYTYIPAEDELANPQSSGEFHVLEADEQGEGPVAYDVWGQRLTADEVEQFLQTDEGRASLSPAEGAVPIDDALLNMGREAFYEETFGNEVYLTDIVGLMDGALTFQNMAKAIAELNGGHTNNLQVELAESVTIGGERYEKGDKIDTGLDVPKGAMTPLGMPISVEEGRVRTGISCAACHATVHSETGEVLEGVPNANLNSGMMMALASNSAAYFTNAEIESLQDYMKENSPTVETSNGGEEKLPDAAELEQAVDEVFASWPPGNFDSTTDMVGNPTQIPDSFTFEDHPYGWSGFAMAGPFKGLSVLNNNVHAQNSDLLGQSDLSKPLFDVDKEVYMGTILQNAANPNFRYDPQSGQKPSEFFESVDPTPGMVGVNENIKPPSYPNPTLMSPNGTMISSPGTHVAEQINAMSAFQNSLRPPEKHLNLDQEKVDQGERVFNRAGCSTCHTGDGYTNHNILPVGEVGADPSRAKAFEDTEKIFAEAKIQSFDTPVPVPEDARVLDVPTDHLSEDQINLAYAHGDTDGGYKVKGLIGLYWTAPYLHDGGVAVGPNENEDLGMAGTLLREVHPDPHNSMKAMLDRDLRQKVIAANQSSEALQQVNVQGIGHKHWVDEQEGFTEEEQEALIEYLFSLTYDDE